MEEGTISKQPRKKLFKMSTIILLVLLLIVLMAEGILVYNWQHKKVTSLQQQVKTLDIQLQYVQDQQNKLEKQLK